MEYDVKSTERENADATAAGLSSKASPNQILTPTWFKNRKYFNQNWDFQIQKIKIAIFNVQSQERKYTVKNKRRAP